jgi:hypothetical protein
MAVPVQEGAGAIEWLPLERYDNYMEPEETAEVMTWLAGATPEDWHLFAVHWNWDNGSMPLVWIIRQDSCDQATAILAFWLNDPSDVFSSMENYRNYHSGKAHDHHRISFCTEILSRWESGQYKNAGLALDYESIRGFVEGYEEEAQRFPDQEKVWRIPPELKRGRDGKTITKQPPWDTLPV